MRVRGFLFALQIYFVLRLVYVVLPYKNDPGWDINHVNSTYGNFCRPKCQFGQEILVKFLWIHDHVALNHSRRCAALGNVSPSLNKFLFYTILLLSNDVNLNPGPSYQVSGPNVLKASTFNARSIVNKRIALMLTLLLKIRI